MRLYYLGMPIYNLHIIFSIFEEKSPTLHSPPDSFHVTLKPSWRQIFWMLS